MDGACSIDGRDDRCMQDFGRKTWKGIDRLQDVSVDGRILLKLILHKSGLKVWAGLMASGGLLWTR
jgi:hypothetical protein